MSRRRKILIGLLVTVLLIGLGARMVYSRLENNLEELNRMVINDVDLNRIDDGTYEGSFSTFPVSATVAVTVKDHEIRDIQLLDHGNGKGEGAEVLPAMVVKAQSVEQDAVSGATYSSRVILKAIENALTSGL